jgi:hypothetical protein
MAKMTRPSSVLGTITAVEPPRKRCGMTMCEPRLTESSSGRPGWSSVLAASLKIPVALMTAFAETAMVSPVSMSSTIAPCTRLWLAS